MKLNIRLPETGDKLPFTVCEVVDSNIRYRLEYEESGYLNVCRSQNNGEDWTNLSTFGTEVIALFLNLKNSIQTDIVVAKQITCTADEHNPTNN